MEYIVFIALFILTILLALFLIFKPVMEDKKVRNNIMNSDLLTQHYCFVLSCNQSEAIKQLTIRNVKDTLEYTFDADCLTIVFLHLGVSIEHQLSFCVVENRTYLKVSRVNFIKLNIKFLLCVRFYYKFL